MGDAERKARIEELLRVAILEAEVLMTTMDRLEDLGYEATTAIIPDLDSPVDGVNRREFTADIRHEIRTMIDEVYPHIEHNRDITLNLFLYIESHTKCLRRYLRLRDEFGVWINTQIGKQIKAMYQLEDTGQALAPDSALIRSYTRH